MSEGSSGAAPDADHADNDHADAGRPSASYRDPDALGARLTTWLAAQLPGATDVTVSGAELPSGSGMSSDTVLFEAAWSEDGAAQTAELVARIAPDPTAVPVFPIYDLAGQFRTLQQVAALSDVPVPNVRWLEEDDKAIGSPFFVMDRVRGQVPPDVMPYNFGSWVTELSPADLTQLQDATIGVLVGLHTIAEPETVFAHLDTRSDGQTSALRAHVEGQRSFYEWVVGDGRRSPLIEASFDWLESNWPATEGPAVLSWGDSRIGNMMFDGVRPVAVLDWEMASLAPAEVDVAWCVFLHRFFEDIAHQLELPGLPQFMRRDEVVTSYAELGGCELTDMDWHSTYAALRHAIVMSRVQRRSIHFGDAPEPDDVDDLIMHRASLQAMLDGTYWSDLD